MTEGQMSSFMERIAATAIANQAIVKCQLSGLPLTVDNVIFFVGDFLDPQDQQFAGLIDHIEQAICDVVEMPWLADKRM